MADQKILKSRLVQKHEYEVDWNNAVNFIPLEAEIIVYNAEADQNGNLFEGVTLPEDRTTPYTYARIKIGDGVTKVKDLPFVDDGKPGEITITGANYGQSAYASVCGERFNDYDDTNGNRALAAGSHAEGIRSIEYDGLSQTVIQNIAGCGCFEIDSKSVLGSYYYYPNFNTTNKTIIVKGNASAYAAGDVISVITDTNFDECATIASVSYNGSDKTTITLQEWPEGLKQGSSNILFDSDNVVKSYVPMTLRVVAKPLIGTTYLGLGAHTEGVGSRALADGAHAEGRETQAVGRYGHTEGRETKAHYAAHAEGWETEAIGDYSHAEGKTTIASGYTAHSEGDTAKATGKTSHAEGFDTLAQGNISHAEGNKTQALGFATHAEGDQTQALKSSAHAEGFKSIAMSESSHAEGESTEAIGKDSHAEGRNTKAGKTQADGSIIGTTAHAEGNGTTAEAYASHAEGSETVASAQYAHAEGLKTKAQGDAAHAEGRETKAFGYNSHAEGSATTASGEISHAEGVNTKALHFGSHAGGGYTETGRIFQTVVGEYNIVDSEALFIVANGTYDEDSSIAEQKNAFVVKEDGSAILQTQGETDNSVVINSTLNAKAAEIVEQLHGTGINREVVETLPAIEEANDYTIYMVNNSSSSENNIYDEYLLINNNWEMIGSTEVDLTNYYIKTEVDDKVNAKPGAKTAQGGEIFNYSENEAFANYSHAEGYRTAASGRAAHAEGNNTEASGDHAHAEGYGTTASGSNSHAEGSDTMASGQGSHTEGLYTTASGYEGPHAEGFSTTASGSSAHAEGSYTMASGESSHAEGYNTKAHGVSTHAEGNNTYAGLRGYKILGIEYRETETDSFCTFILKTVTDLPVGKYSTILNGILTEDVYSILSIEQDSTTGYYKAITDQCASADTDSINFEDPETICILYFGKGEIGASIFGNYSHSEGSETRALGSRSHAEGNKTLATALGAHAEGDQTQATTTGAHAEGYLSRATGKLSHAEGRNTHAAGYASHAEGDQTITNNNAAHAEGYKTQATGTMSHAEGDNNIASANAAHAEGRWTEANHQGSHAGGYATRTGMAYQTVIGKYNKGLNNTLFEVGDGTASTEEGRANAFEVYEDGHAEVQTMGESNNSVTTKEYVDSAINALETKKTVSVNLTKGDTNNYNINYDEINSATKFTARVQFHAHGEYLFDVPLTFGQYSDGKTFVLSGMIYLNSIDSASGSNPGFKGFNLYCTYPTDDLNLCNIRLYSEHAVTVYSISYQ